MGGGEEDVRAGVYIVNRKDNPRVVSARAPGIREDTCVDIRTLSREENDRTLSGDEETPDISFCSRVQCKTNDPTNPALTPTPTKREFGN